MAAGLSWLMTRGRGAGPETCDSVPGDDAGKKKWEKEGCKRRERSSEKTSIAHTLQFDFGSYSESDSYCTCMKLVHHACMENGVQDPDVHKKYSIYLETCLYGKIISGKWVSIWFKMTFYILYTAVLFFYMICSSQKDQRELASSFMYVHEGF